MKRLFLIIFLFFFFKNTTQGQIMDKSWEKIVNQKESNWFGTKEAKVIAENVLIYQRNIGG